MSNETLILKSGVSTGSTIKLTDCPLKSGEILETVCRLFANGMTSGNRAIKALGDSVKYNTEAVSNGSLYCVAYKDGGFYVGARESEDYEPKVGDWWTFSSKRQDIGYNNPKLLRTSFYKVCGFDFFVAFQDEKSRELLGGYRYIGKTNTRYLSVTNDSYQGILSTKGNNEDYLFPISASSHDGETVHFRTEASRNENIKSDFGWDIENSRPIIYAFKPVTSSDILAYQATGHMGALFLGEETQVNIPTYAFVVINKESAEEGSIIKIATAFYKSDGSYFLSSSSASERPFFQILVYKDGAQEKGIVSITSDTFYRDKVKVLNGMTLTTFTMPEGYNQWTLRATSGSDGTMTAKYWRVLKDNTETATTLSMEDGE